MNGIPIFRLYREAYRGLSSGSWLLGVTLLINRSGTMVVPFMSLYLTQSLHYDIIYAGYAMMCFGAGSVLGGFLGGRFAGRRGFYPVMVGSLVTSGLLFILLGFVRNFTWFCLVSFVLAVAADAFRPTTGMAVAAYSTEENRTRTYSLQRLAVNLGWGAGMALGGWLASISYRLIFWADGITSLMAAAFILFFLKKPADGGKQAEPPRHEHDGGMTAWRDRIYLFFILLSIIFGVCFFQSSTMLPLFYKEVVKLDEHQFGWIMSLNGLMIATMEMVLVYSLDGKRNSLTYIKVGVALLAISFLALIGLPHLLWVMVFSMVVMTFGEMMSMPFMNSFWIGRSKYHNRGDYAGLYTMSWSIAQITSPLLGTQLVKQFGFDALWWTCIGMCGMIFLGFYYLRKKVSAF
jgi:predicted MFS family arabinose efflux permease